MALVERFDDTLASMRALSRPRATVLVGIDGHGGSGKSTFAARLQAHAADVTIVHIDDFGHLEGYPNPDWPRVREQVLDPLREDRPTRYQRRDWVSGELAEWHPVSAGGIVVVEGVGALRREIQALFDFRIWVEAPRALCLIRGVARDGEAMRAQWEEWLTTEDAYLDAHQPIQSADLLVDGSESVPHVLDLEYVRLPDASWFR